LKSFTVLPLGAYAFLVLEEHLFLKQCQVDTYAASGPGGQKRNRTYSAVRIRHSKTGLSVIAEESRSQAENKIKALKRLKKAIALNIRKDPASSAFKLHETMRPLFHQDSSLRINIKNPLYPMFCATVLDAVFAAGGKTANVSEILKISTGKLNKILSRDRDLLGAANQIRQHFGLKPLKES